MKLQTRPYPLERLEEEQLRLFNARNLAEEDTALANIRYHRGQLAEMGVVYDEGNRRWTNELSQASSQILRKQTIQDHQLPEQTGTYEWELRFPSQGGSSGEVIRIIDQSSGSVVQAIEMRKLDAEIWRDGRYVCKMFAARRV